MKLNECIPVREVVVVHSVTWLREPAPAPAPRHLVLELRGDGQHRHVVRGNTSFGFEVIIGVALSRDGVVASIQSGVAVSREERRRVKSNRCAKALIRTPQSTSRAISHRLNSRFLHSPIAAVCRIRFRIKHEHAEPDIMASQGRRTSPLPSSPPRLLDIPFGFGFGLGHSFLPFTWLVVTILRLDCHLFEGRSERQVKPGRFTAAGNDRWRVKCF
ncbi:hypothetical protein EDB83DRAFT_1650301 [Lactarius deliciosus]|nr:hypothetical protein EDB83DRAFT_1650301 [Lactarius deliciosus]